MFNGFFQRFMAQYWGFSVTALIQWHIPGERQAAPMMRRMEPLPRKNNLMVL